MSLTVFDELVEIARESPGPAAARGVVAALSSLAVEGDRGAAVALGRIFAADLGLPDFGATGSPEAVPTAEMPALVKLYVTGFAPRLFLADPETVRRLAREVGPEVFERFQAMVRRDAPGQDAALTAFILLGFANFAGGPVGESMKSSARQRVLRDITRTSRVVPGDSVDSTFAVGRDVVLGVASLERFLGPIYHEFGHHVTNDLRSGQEESFGHDLARGMAGAVPRLLEESARLAGRPVGPADPRTAVLPAGLVIICTTHGQYTHLSLSQAGGPIDFDYAVGCALLLVELLGVPPADVVVAYSPGGVFHLACTGFPAAFKVRFRAVRKPVVTPDLPQRAAAWFAELERTGRVGHDEQDVAALVTGAERAARVHAESPRTAMRDLAIRGNLRDGGDLSQFDAETLVHAAVACGDPVAVRNALAADVPLLGLADLGRSRAIVVDDGLTHAGTSRDDLYDVIRVLHEAGRDVDEAVNDQGDSLLSDAAARSADLTSFLLAHGADANHKNRDGVTPLVRAAMSGQWRVVEALLHAGARLDERDVDGRTALHHAVSSGHPEVAARLLAGGAGADVADSTGRTPLMNAVTPALVTLLCERGADPNTADHSGNTALIGAAARGDVEVVRELLRRGADPSAVTDRGDAAIHHASVAGIADRRLAVVTALLDAGADVDEENNEGMTALMAACMDAHPETVELLISRGADVEARTVQGFTPLMHAADGRNQWSRDPTHNDRAMECLRLLAGAGASLDARSNDGWTALHFASLGFDAGPVALLLELGADPNIATDAGVTPLAQAEAQGHGKMIEDLIGAGAREDVR
ncbi:ankyrin repeat domain-containing protein [Saccharothrix sp. ALI-22-I]|uniref:ankyrin repeat domain-containing protein n=1 Tax=Saccharothrix sp. ALI-22-I TaxID=1933778 RepID=UPI00117A05B8|nr:ankyrin repeat domain-containing protein [Saccharothrix sp. ALI-22-I]